MPAWQSPATVNLPGVTDMHSERERDRDGGNGREREMSMDTHHDVYTGRLVRSTPPSLGRGRLMLVGRLLLMSRKRRRAYYRPQLRFFSRLTPALVT